MLLNLEGLDENARTILFTSCDEKYLCAIDDGSRAMIESVSLQASMNDAVSRWRRVVLESAEK
jgi:hypothetical protein